MLLSLIALPLAALALTSSVKPLPAPLQADLNATYKIAECPVRLTELRLLTVTHWGFDGGTYTGQLVVNEKAAAPLARVFKQLYELHFPIRHMLLSDLYGPKSEQPADGDVSGSFDCRPALASPCSKAAASKNWSNHAYGLAVDLNPGENPYVGCGRTRDANRDPYLDRKRLRPGMVTPAVVRAFRSIGWGWGGDWSGSTRDYMHFSWNGH
jgi:hypothetical protein